VQQCQRQQQHQQQKNQNNNTNIKKNNSSADSIRLMANYKAIMRENGKIKFVIKSQLIKKG
jgi:hypothetical protein